MDIDFIVQDTFSLTRPQWKLARNFEEAGRAFADMVKQNYKTQQYEKAVEPEEPEDDSSDGELDEDDLQVPEMDDGQSSGEEADAEVIHILLHETLGYADDARNSPSMAKLMMTRILTSKSLLPDKRRSVTPKRKLNLTGNCRK